MCFRISPSVAVILLRRLIHHGSRDAHASVFNFHPARSLSVTAEDASTATCKLQKAFSLLGVGQDSNTAQIKEAYINMVKKYHPDSKSPHADAKMFSEIRDAYRRCVSYAKNVAISQEISTALEEELHKIETNLGFTSPQRLAHRHFLTYDVGPGTQSERQKAYSQFRLNQAMENVFERQFLKALENQEDKKVGPYTGSARGGASKHSSQTLERIADDTIQKSMKRGEFSKLQGAGKPLEKDYEHVGLDNLQTKLNKVLMNSGFAPEWISLDKEIRNSIKTLKVQMTSVWHKCGPHPMNPLAVREWEHHMRIFQDSVENINTKINLLNLIVPVLSMQRVLVRLDHLVAQISSEVPVKVASDGCAKVEKAGQCVDSEMSQCSDSKTASTLKGFCRSLLNKLLGWSAH